MVPLFVLNGITAALWAIIFSIGGYVFGRGLEAMLGHIHVIQAIILSILVGGIIAVWAITICAAKRSSVGKRRRVIKANKNAGDIPRHKFLQRRRRDWGVAGFPAWRHILPARFAGRPAARRFPNRPRCIIPIQAGCAACRCCCSSGCGPPRRQWSPWVVTDQLGDLRIGELGKILNQPCHVGFVTALGKWGYSGALCRAP